MSKAIVREFVERFNRGDSDGLRDLFHEHAQIHEGTDWTDLDGAMAAWEQAIDGLGVDLDIERIVAEEEVIALLYTERGWSRAAYLGRPATGRSYELPAVDWFTIEEGRILRLWRVRDRASLAQQLGWETTLPASSNAARVA